MRCCRWSIPPTGPTALPSRSRRCAATTGKAEPAEEPISAALKIDDLKIELGYALLPLVNSADGTDRLTEQIKALRRDHRKGRARRGADLGGAQDRRPEDRARLCAAAAGQFRRRDRPPYRADQGAAPRPPERPSPPRSRSRRRSRSTT